MENQIDEEVKNRRQEILMTSQLFITEQVNKNRVGKRYDVVVDGFDGENYFGRSYLDAPEIDSAILFSSEKPLNTGDFTTVMITDFDGYDLIGEVVE